MTPEFPKNIIQEKPQLRLLYYQIYILYIMTQIRDIPKMHCNIHV